MQITRKDIGYSIYSRLEESLRFWIKGKLLNLYGSEWYSSIPQGIWDKTKEKLSFVSPKEIDDPLMLLDETDIPDLVEIVGYKKTMSNFIPQALMSVEDFKDKFIKLYDIRNKIAHVKRNFSAIDLDLLIEIADSFISILGIAGKDLRETLNCIKTNPDKIIIRIPPSFFIYEDKPDFAHITNLPSGDYDPDGGFIGRKEDLNKTTALILGNLHRVITISGAGGVGKTALVHQICQNLLNNESLPFDGLVWVSAKEEKLTTTGIEPIEPTLRNYESLLDAILETFGWIDCLVKPIKEKEEAVEIILRVGDKGILIVVDNLETIRDERVVEFIKDGLPSPNKILITSRLGLGEVERRYPLKEMNNKDAITLLRTVAREKGADRLAQFSDDVLLKYVNKISRYPLAIKWVVGQVAIGKDINMAIGDLTSSKGDVARFCFENIFDKLLDNNARMVLYALAVNDKPLLRGVLSHVSNLAPEELDNALRDLTIASLVVPNQIKSSDDTIETRYELLHLTKNYIQSKLKSNPEIHRGIMNRTEMVQNLIEEAERAGTQYRYSLRDMGAESEEEKVAATWAITAYQKYQGNNYDGAVNAFKRATQIAPNFPPIYRNWANMESDAGFYEKALELMQQATKLDPSDSKLWLTWGNIEKKWQRFDRSYEYLKRAASLSPDDGHILGSLGEVEKRRGNYDEADKLLHKALLQGQKGPKRDELICYTALADNYRRWAEFFIHEKLREEAFRKLEDAFIYSSKAMELGEDIRAHNTFLEVCREFATFLLYSEGINKAMPFFNKVIKENPEQEKERKLNEACCYYLAKTFLYSDKIDEAKYYLNLGKKSLYPNSSFFNKYKILETEFCEERKKGKLCNVAMKGDYGFVEIDEKTGHTIFLHISQIFPRISSEEFINMVGSSFTFVLENTVKGPEAKKARLIKDEKNISN
ncbi:MAG: NB-ARC domain-containing protein [Syntrophorhabdaceae bacterium]|nr:NB-ARC domain-containing protein [Syntrophorhabdaceae bacterium]